MENIEYLKNELEKDINQIDWNEFLRVAKCCYDKSLEKSLLGFNKGVINIIMNKNSYSSGLYDYLRSNNNFFEVFWCNNQPSLNRLIKDNKLNDNLLKSDKYVIIFIGNTAALIKKIFNLKWSHLLFKITKSKNIYYLSQGENKIKFNKESLTGIHRDNILSKLLE